MSEVEIKTQTVYTREVDGELQEIKTAEVDDERATVIYDFVQGKSGNKIVSFSEFKKEGWKELNFNRPDDTENAEVE